MSLSDQQFNQVKGVFDAKGIPTYVWVPIMLQESGGDPMAHATIGEDSRGLFQVNVQANPAYAGQNLFDPVVNAQVAADHFIGPQYFKSKATITDPSQLTADVWRNGIRPNWDQAVKSGKVASLMVQATEIAAGTPIDKVDKGPVSVQGTGVGPQDSGPWWKDPLGYFGSSFQKAGWMILGALILLLGLYVMLQPEVAKAGEQALDMATKGAELDA